MENKNHGGHHARPVQKGGGSAFIWGLLIGAVLTTLLTTQKGRRILREVAELGFELLEDFIEDRVGRKEASSMSADETEEVKEDLESEVAEAETVTTPAQSSSQDASEQSLGQVEITEKDSDEKIEEVKAPKANGNGHKKRLFRGIRRK